MKILLIANVGTASNNFYHVGDEAMFLETYNWYQKHHPKYKLSVLTSQSNHSNLKVLEIVSPIEFQFINKRTIFKLILKLKINNIFKINLLTYKEKYLVSIIKKNDRIHFCGGGNINSLFSGWLYYSLLIIKISTILNREIVLTSQTMGPFNFIDKLLAFSILNKVEIIAVRGHTDTLKNIGIISPKIFNMLDAAYKLPIYTNKSLPKKKNFRIGLSLHEWKNSEKFFEALIASLEKISETNSIEIVLIPHVLVNDDNQWDMGFMSKLFSVHSSKIKIIKQKTSHILSSKPEPAYYIKKLTGTVDLLISTRYHGLIFALSQNIPVLTYTSDTYYSDKNTNALKFYYPNNFNKYSISSQNINLKPTLTTTIRSIIKNNIQEKQNIKKINSKLLIKYDLFKKNLNHKILD